MSPQFSIAPAAKSGMPIRSSFGSVYGIPNRDSKAGSTFTVMSRAVARLPALRQQHTACSEHSPALFHWQHEAHSQHDASLSHQQDEALHCHALMDQTGCTSSTKTNNRHAILQIKENTTPFGTNAMISQVSYQAEMQYSVFTTQCAAQVLAKENSLSKLKHHALPVWCAVNADIAVWSTWLWVRHHGSHAGQIAHDQGY